MKKQLFLPIASVAAGVVCFALRLLQNKTGFESSTGLPISGNIPAIALVALLVLVSAGLFWKTRTLNTTLLFPADFSVQEPALLTLPVMGILLLAASGLLDAFAIARPGLIPFAETSSSPSSQLLFAVTAIASSASLYSAIAVCRIHTPGEIASSEALAKKKSTPSSTASLAAFTTVSTDGFSSMSSKITYSCPFFANASFTSSKEPLFLLECFPVTIIAFFPSILNSSL